MTTQREWTHDEWRALQRRLDHVYWLYQEMRSTFQALADDAPTPELRDAFLSSAAAISPIFDLLEMMPWRRQ